MDPRVLELCLRAGALRVSQSAPGRGSGAVAEPAPPLLLGTLQAGPEPLPSRTWKWRHSKHQFCLVLSAPQTPFLPLRPTVLFLKVYTFDLGFLAYYEMQISTPGNGLLSPFYCPLGEQPLRERGQALTPETGMQ